MSWIGAAWGPAVWDFAPLIERLRLQTDGPDWPHHPQVKRDELTAMINNQGTTAAHRKRRGLVGKIADDQSPTFRRLRTRVSQTIRLRDRVSRADTSLWMRWRTRRSARIHSRKPLVAIGVIAGAAHRLDFWRLYDRPRRSFMGMIRRRFN